MVRPVPPYPAPMPAESLPPVAVTSPSVTVMVPNVPDRPLPMPAPCSPPVAVTVPPETATETPEVR